MGQAAVPRTAGAEMTAAAAAAWGEMTEVGAGVDGFPVINCLSSNLPNRAVVFPSPF